MAVRIERRDPIATVVIDRPEARNAVDRPTAEALAACIRELDTDPSVAAIVLWGAGGHFCAGADLKALGTGRSNRLDPVGDGPMGPTRLQTVKPVIAAIEGYAVAGGLELACWADLRILAEDAILGVFCRRWGVPLIDGGTVRLPRLVGGSRAMDLILTGRAVDAQEAMSIGLANRVVPSGTARQAAEVLAMRLASFPQACLRADLANARAALGGPLEDALTREFASAVHTLDDPATHEGVARFSDGAGRHGAGS